MRPTLTRYTQALACAAALLALAACGGDADGEKTSASGNSTSSEPTYSEDRAFAEAKNVQPKLRAHDPNTPLPENTEWATASYIKAYNGSRAEMKKQGITEKGTVTVKSTHLAESNPDAVGGWVLKMYECSTSTVRYYQGSKDVTSRPEDPSKPAPKGPQENVHLVSYTTPDGGKTWQLDKSQLLIGKESKKSPCAK